MSSPRVFVLLLALAGCSSNPPPTDPLPPTGPASTSPAPNVTGEAPSASTSPAQTATAAPTAVASAAPTASASAAPAQGPSYVACGCGCCGGVQPKKQCIYHSKGDDLAKIQKDDEQHRNDPQCRFMGCSMGTLYTYCD